MNIYAFSVFRQPFISRGDPIVISPSLSYRAALSHIVQRDSWPSCSLYYKPHQNIETPPNKYSLRYSSLLFIQSVSKTAENSGMPSCKSLRPGMYMRLQMVSPPARPLAGTDPAHFIPTVDRHGEYSLTTYLVADSNGLAFL